MKPGETTADGKFTVKGVECLAACGGAPAVQVNGEWLEHATSADVDKVIAGEKVARSFAWPKSPGEHILFANVWKEGSTSLAVYEAGGGYAKLGEWLKREPEAIVDEVKKSGLRGRGGAGFPTGMKWGFLPKDNPKPRYMCVNADESEPGTYKDRVIIERDPHQLIEGTVVSCHAIRSKTAYIYIRGEFHEGARTLDKALAEARAKGYVGKNILGTGVDVEIHVHRGAGSYECGEETALIESLEGKRGQPRIKPPFPAVVGLYGCPTIVNNVETLVNVPLDPDARARVVRGLRHREERRAQALLDQRPRGAPRQLRGADGQDHAARADLRPGLRAGHARRRHAQGRRPGRLLDAGADGGRDRRPDGLRRRRQGRLDARLRRHHRDGRLHLHGVDGEEPDLLLQARVVRQVLAVPRGHRLDAAPADEDRGGPGAAERHRPALQGLPTRSAARRVCPFGDAAIAPPQSSLKKFRAEFDYHVREKRCWKSVAPTFEQALAKSGATVGA